MNRLSGPPTGRYGVRMGTTCAAHKHDSWVPLNDHHIWPLGDGGPDTKANQVTLCANAHYSVHALLDNYAKRTKAGLPARGDWAFERNFSPYIRNLADRGWAAITESRAA